MNITDYVSGRDTIENEESSDIGSENWLNDAQGRHIVSNQKENVQSHHSDDPVVFKPENYENDQYEHHNQFIVYDGIDDEFDDDIECNNCDDGRDDDGDDDRCFDNDNSSGDVNDNEFGSGDPFFIATEVSSWNEKLHITVPKVSTLFSRTQERPSWSSKHRKARCTREFKDAIYSS